MTHYNDDKAITEIKYNFIQVSDGHQSGADYDIFRVDGKLGTATVLSIKEHPAQGEGDKFFYDVFFDDETVMRIFNPNTITFKFV